MFSECYFITSLKASARNISPMAIAAAAPAYFIIYTMFSSSAIPPKIKSTPINESIMKPAALRILTLVSD